MSNSFGMTHDACGDGLKIGAITLANPVLLAPMSGITDLPFRRLALSLGAGMVVTEMIASRDLVSQRKETLRRAAGHKLRPFVIQLAGREARWMGEGAKLAADMGADAIDINMGCPAKKVTRGFSGSALMRDEDHALRLIEATVEASDVPVTLKMRMGWDHASLNAPSLARRAENAGVRMITVHGRTRCQFFKGRADWRFIAGVKRAVCGPVVANGDVERVSDVAPLFAQSGADGVMIGRGARGRPWFPGRVARYLESGVDPGDPPLERQRAVVLEHYHLMLSHYGVAHGVRIARKHLGWYVAGVEASADAIRHWRDRLCRTDDPRIVEQALTAFYDERLERAS